MAKSASPKAATKSEIFAAISEKTGLSRKQVASVFEELNGVVKANLGKKGSGIFTLPGIAKFTIRVKPATPARKGIDPFTKQEKLFKAKPASRGVKIRALKALKDLVA